MVAYGYVGGDPGKQDSGGYIQGDVLAADSAGVLQAVPIGSTTEVLTVVALAPELVDWQPGGGGGGGTPSNTVVTETSFGQPSTAGVGTDYSRGDHTHGTPAAPTAASVGADPAGSAAAAQAAAIAAAATDATTKANAAQAAAIAAAATDATTKANAAQAAAIAAAATDATTKANAAQAAAILASNTRLVMRQAYVTTGDITMPNTGAAWAPLSGFPELLIPAAVGDYVEININGMRTDGDNRLVDVAVITGAGPTIQRYMATGTSSPAIEGNPGWYFDVAGFVSYKAPQGFVVAAGDLDTGNVRFAIVLKTSTTAGTFYASTNYPFYWRSFNYGPVN